MSVINKNTALAGALAFAAKSAAHGIVTGILADGTYNLGYDPSFQYQRPPPAVAGWSIPEVQDRGFVSDLNGPDIVCHRGATPGQAYVQIAAGGTLEFQWTEWPESHHGPVIDYLAPCGDDCTTIDKESLKFIKVAEAGLVDGAPSPGHWASDDMIANNNTWVVKVPSDVAPGKYVWRHETIALHAAHEAHGAQAYPQCVNVEITGSGTNDLSGGISAEDFYTWEDPGIAINIYYPVVESYTIPGPPLMEGGESGSAPAPAPSSGSSLPTGGYGNSTVVPTGGSSPRPTGTRPTGRPGGYGNSTVVPTGGNPPRPTGARPTGRPGGNNPPSGSVEITATPTAPTQVVESTPSSAINEPPIKPNVPSGAPQVPGAGEGEGETKPEPTGTSPISFTTTFTGRIGKATKFTCYIEE